MFTFGNSVFNTRINADYSLEAILPCPTAALAKSGDGWIFAFEKNGNIMIRNIIGRGVLICLLGSNVAAWSGSAFAKRPSGYKNKAFFVERNSGTAVPDTVVTLYPLQSAREIELRPILLWQASAGARTYQVQLDTSASFSGFLISRIGITDLFLDAGNLADNQTYYWRIRAVNSRGASEWSRTRTFKTLVVPAAPLTPVPVFPPDDFVHDSTSIALLWSVGQLASSYGLELANNTAFSPALQYLDIRDSTFSSAGLDVNTTYYWRVKANNSLGTSPWSKAWSFRVEVPRPLVAPVIDTPDTTEKNMSTRVELRWHSVAGATTYNLEMAENSAFSPGMLHRDIRDTSITMAGLKYNTTYYWRVHSLSHSAKSAWSKVSSFQTIPAIPHTYTLIHTFAFVGEDKKRQLNSKDYRLIGLPGISELHLMDIVSGVPGVDWQAFLDNGEEINYLIPVDHSDDFRFTGGNAFWVLANKNIELNVNIPAPVVDAKGVFDIPLHDGWNLIANPFDRPILWRSVQVINRISQPVWAYEQGFLAADTLKPYQGYYYYNEKKASAVTISYDAIFKVPPLGQKQIQPCLWQARISLCNAAGVLDEVVLGVAEAAGNGIDEFDVIKPNGLHRKATLSLHATEAKRSRIFARDVRPPISGVTEWPFVVQADESDECYLRFEGLDDLPPEYRIILLSELKVPMQDLRRNPVVPLRRELQSQRFTLIVGKNEDVDFFVSSRQPEQFMLGANFPNPFNPQTRIPIYLPENTDVKLAVYNYLGRLTAVLFKGRLAKGAHSFIWNGKHMSGKRVPSGVYFYRLETPTSRSTKKMTLIR